MRPLLTPIISSHQDKYGNTALHMSVWYELPEMYNLLVDYDEWGIEYFKNRQEMTALKLAAARGSTVSIFFVCV